MLVPRWELGAFGQFPEIPVTPKFSFDVWQSMTERAMWVYAGTKCGSIRKGQSLGGRLC